VGTLVYSPRTHPAQGADPTSAPLDQPFYVCTFNQQWAPYILGALEVLAQDEYWLAGEAPARVDDLFLGLSLNNLTPTGDQKDGIYRAAGCTLLWSTSSWAGLFNLFQYGPNSANYTALCPTKAGLQAGFHIQSRGIDSASNNASVRYTNIFTWKNDTQPVTDATVVLVERGNPTPQTFTNVNPRTVLNGKNVVSADITRLNGEFGILIDVRGPDLGV
jgi:hypothetical protein